MLETEIKNLAAEIKMLREAMTANNTPVEPTPVDKPKAEPTPVDKPAVVVDEITVEELQALCAGIMRVDKTMRPSIAALLGEYNATRVDQVPESDFPALSDALKKLGA